MPGIVIVGAQWGDEGKGKITDLLAEQADAVVRFQGGNNAGHTIVRGEVEWKLHLVPSGILYPGKTCVIGNGVVIDPRVLLDELDALRARGVDVSGLRISANAHLIMPYHMLLDSAGEAKLGSLQIGTTRRGIGPCYADKAARLGIRVQDLLDEKILKKKIVAAMEPKRLSLRPFEKDPALDLRTMTEDFLKYGHRLEQHIADTSKLMWQLLDDERIVILEGAQGAMLDIDHGTYPFVTSSNPLAGAAAVGTGIGPKAIDEVWGISKAYTTRVGAGPFPSELHDEMAETLRERGGEFGTTTGRARRTGWLDLVALRYAARLNTMTSLVVTKLDVLSGLDRIKVCTGYLGADEAEFEDFPYHQTVLHHTTAKFTELAGWKEDLGECRTPSDLPAGAREYLDFIAERTGVEVALIGVGPGREQVIWTEAGRSTLVAPRTGEYLLLGNALRPLPLVIGALLTLSLGACAGTTEDRGAVTSGDSTSAPIATLGPRTKTSGCHVKGLLPDRACTPASIFTAATVSQICRSGYSRSVRNVPESLKRKVYAEYGIRSHIPYSYEVDHLVSLELGGSNSIANLWPEISPGFREKDKIENRLHDAVCSHEVSLRTAQRQIARDWRRTAVGRP